MMIRVLGAGVAGLTCAYEFAQAGVAVEIVERASGPGLGCSFHAGGMIAPWCEEEGAEPLVVTLGREALDYWTKTVPAATVHGTLVIAPPRDRPDLLRFARLTSHHEKLGAEKIAALEPDLAGRFDEALSFPEEAHLDPRQAMAMLAARLRQYPNVAFRFNTDAETISEPADWTIDCRGFAARDAAQRSARRQRRNACLGDARHFLRAAGAHAASAPSGLYRAARRWALHDRRDDDRKRRAAAASPRAPCSNC